MNFKFLFLILFITGCGLKTAPRAPKNTLLPSIPKSYFTHPEEEKKKEKSDDEQDSN